MFENFDLSMFICNPRKKYEITCSINLDTPIRPARDVDIPII